MMRPLRLEDHKQYSQLIDSNIMVEDYNDFVTHRLNKDHRIVVMANEEGMIMGAGTLLTEYKMTHGGCKMGHIENVIVRPDARGQHIGKRIIEELVASATAQGCYRVDLNCEEGLVGFYAKSDFSKCQSAMSLFIKKNFSR